ncbi:MAG: hypothetical protein J6U86_05025 [Clostridia bacterium]|nr:hypothetical protein [Clostridia bacterium]
MENEIIVQEAPAELDELSAVEEVITPPDHEAEIARLNEEIRILNQRLTQKQERESLMGIQIEEFTRDFPEVDLKSIPEEVFDGMRSGNSLASSYALYKIRADRISEQNQKNAYRSSGRIGKSAASEYFSADEVRKMSPSEVKANYTKIIESMKKWN